MCYARRPEGASLLAGPTNLTRIKAPSAFRARPPPLARPPARPNAAPVVPLIHQCAERNRRECAPRKSNTRNGDFQFWSKRGSHPKGDEPFISEVHEITLKKNWVLLKISNKRTSSCNRDSRKISPLYNHKPFHAPLMLFCVRAARYRT